jgi:hypothetical protein
LERQPKSTAGRPAYDCLAWNLTFAYTRTRPEAAVRERRLPERPGRQRVSGIAAESMGREADGMNDA